MYYKARVKTCEVFKTSQDWYALPEPIFMQKLTHQQFRPGILAAYTGHVVAAGFFAVYIGHIAKERKLIMECFREMACAVTLLPNTY
jgi:hypothetical protein